MTIGLLNPHSSLLFCILSLMHNIYRKVENDLFPDFIRLVITQEPVGMECLLLEEKALVKGASDKRKKDFATGRFCARKALSHFNVMGVPILNDKSRKPLWPQGFVGSISHCPGLYGAAVAELGACRSLGFDMESLRRKVEEDYIMGIILHPDEQQERWDLPEKEAGLRTLTIFSIKECFFKCMFPLVGKYIGFKSVRCRLKENTGTFVVHIMKDISREFSAGTEVSGRFMVVGDYVFSGMYLEA
jgi:4'-phosphopantetheinyl transferase EntD